ncbi:hypothetical protein EGH26_06570 [Halomicroarcula pellucida]|nr:hypothetical protein [Halomicroarcula pellucida]
MMLRRLLPLSYAWMVGQGLLAVFLPRQAIKLNAKFLLSGYENPGDLEPKDWYVRATRIAGVGMLVTGLTGLLAGELDADEDVEPVEIEGEDGHQVAESDESV